MCHSVRTVETSTTLLRPISPSIHTLSVQSREAQERRTGSDGASTRDSRNRLVRAVVGGVEGNIVGVVGARRVDGGGGESALDVVGIEGNAGLGCAGGRARGDGVDGLGGVAGGGGLRVDEPRELLGAGADVAFLHGRGGGGSEGERGREGGDDCCGVHFRRLFWGVWFF